MFCGPSTADFPRLRLGKHRRSRIHKTYCFPRSQSISVNYITLYLSLTYAIYSFTYNIFFHIYLSYSIGIYIIIGARSSRATRAAVSVGQTLWGLYGGSQSSFLTKACALFIQIELTSVSMLRNIIIDLNLVFSVVIISYI